MEQSRRAYLRGVGGIALGVGLAGCSSDNGGEGGGGSPENGGGGATDGSGSGSESGGGSASGTETSGSEAAASGGGGGGSATPGQDAAATGLSGTVADKSAQGVSFVSHSHYSMNGVQGVTGRLKNTSNSAIEEITLHTTVQPGNAGPYTETLDGPIKPGETRRFKFGFGDGAPDEVQSYTIWATTGSGQQGTAQQG